MRVWPRRTGRSRVRTTSAPRGRPFPTRDGDWVRSMPEKRIADWLSRSGIPYAYEPRLVGLRPDFALVDHPVVIEYWGGAGHGRYARRMAEKTARYEAAGVRVVHLLPVHGPRLEAELEAGLVDALKDNP